MKKIKAAALLICLAVLLSGCSALPQNGTAVPAEPSPAGEQSTAEPTGQAEEFTFSINSLGRLFAVCSGAPGEGLKRTLSLSESLFNAAGFPVKAAFGSESDILPGDIVIRQTEGLEPEEFSTVIGEKNITVYYTPCADSGFFEGGESCRNVLFALNTLLKRIISLGEAALAPCTLTDRPDTAERTLMLDCARKQWSVPWIRMLISEMSWMGYTSLELHMTEEQGIRFNIWQSESGEKVPDSNGNDFSFICGGTKVSWNPDNAENTEAFICREQITEIVEFARSRRIEIIPTVDLPGHSTNLLSRCEKQAQSGALAFYRSGRLFTYGGSSLSAPGSKGQTVNITSGFARELSLAVAEGYADFFRSLGCEKFNIGADEVSADPSGWESYAAENGGQTAHDAFIIYINSLTAMLKEKGYSVRAFNDYLFREDDTAALDPELEICFWSTGGKTPGELAESGRKIYNCIENNCYYPLRTNSSGLDARDEKCETWSFNHSTARRIFGGCGEEDCPGASGWDPTRFWKNQTELVSGGYFLIWGDFAALDSEDNIFFRTDDYGLVDRMWANCEKMIHRGAAGNIGYDEFSASVAPFRLSPDIRQ